jgi:DNA-binding GntR family transcriptional regulator
LKNLPVKFEQIEKPKSLNELTYQQLKASIVEGNMVPGVVYTEVGLSKSLGISRTPVREALLRLAAENFIIFYPRKGMSVKLFSRKEVEGLFELRQALEETAYGKIAGHLTPKQIQEVRNIIREQASSEITFSKNSRRFHLYLIEAHGNRFITQTYNNILDSVAILIRETLAQKGRAKEAVSEHKKILDALIAGDAEATKRAVQEHLRISKRNALESIAHQRTELQTPGE